MDQTVVSRRPLEALRFIISTLIRPAIQPASDTGVQMACMCECMLSWPAQPVDKSPPLEICTETVWCGFCCLTTWQQTTLQ